MNRPKGELGFHVLFWAWPCPSHALVSALAIFYALDVMLAISQNQGFPEPLDRPRRVCHLEIPISGSDMFEPRNLGLSS
jgi:hypothetical protein